MKHSPQYQIEAKDFALGFRRSCGNGQILVLYNRVKIYTAKSSFHKVLGKDFFLLHHTGIRILATRPEFLQ